MTCTYAPKVPLTCGSQNPGTAVPGTIRGPVGNYWSPLKGTKVPPTVAGLKSVVVTTRGEK